jgi:hypothetical protein
MNIKEIMNQCRCAVMARIEGDYYNPVLIHFGTLAGSADDIEHILITTAKEIRKELEKYLISEVFPPHIRAKR